VTITIRQLQNGHYLLTIARDGLLTESTHAGLFGALRKLTGTLWGKGVAIHKRRVAA
jgi:hypothetical protein